VSSTGGQHISVLLVSAGTISCGVGVAVLGHGVVAFVISESAGLPSSIATVAGLNTINKLLLSKGLQITRFDLVGTFHRSGGGEGPA